MNRQSSAAAMLRAATIRKSASSRVNATSRASILRRTIVTDAKNANIAVLGGGLTGLTTAYYLAKKLPSTAKITIYESGDRLGGWIRTEKTPVNVGGKSGIVSFERGPRSLTSLYNNMFRFDDLVLYDLALDLALNLNSPPIKPRYIYYPDHIVNLPPNISMLGMMNEPLYRQSIGTAFGLAYNFYTRQRRLPTDDISVQDWLYSITGSHQSTNTFASAMVHGIYGGDIGKLSARSVLDRVYWNWYKPDDKDLSMQRVPLNETRIIKTLGQDRHIQHMALQPKSPLIDFGDAGMEALPKAMVAALEDQPNVSFKLGDPIKNVSYDRDNKTVQITGSDPNQSPASYDKVISTLSAQTIARLTGKALPALSDFQSVSIMTVNLWFPQEDLKPPGFGYLIPNSVDPSTNPEHALGVFYDSDVSTRSEDEPAGTKLFVLMGGHYYNRPGVTIPTEEEAIVQARNLLERHLGIPRDAPCHAVAGFAKDCIPQHHVGHQDRLKTASQELRQAFDGRLAVAGGSFSRIGVIAALRSGYDAADATHDKIDNTGLEYLDTQWDSTLLDKGDIPVRPLRKIAM